MRVQIKATNMDLTDAISEYVQKKANMLDRFMNVPGTPDDPLAECEVEKVTGQHHNKGDVFRCEMQIDLGKELLRVEKTTEDMYKAIEKVKDEMERQLVRRKEKARDHIRRS